MRELYQLKDKLTDELKAYGGKKEITGSTIAMIDTLAHAVKNIDKIIEKYEEEESYSSMPSHEGGSMRGSYEGMSGYSRRYSRDGSYEGSYARGRGRYARRDAMGRYSREGSSMDGDVMTELQDLMRNAPDEKTRQKIQAIMETM